MHHFAWTSGEATTTEGAVAYLWGHHSAGLMELLALQMRRLGLLYSPLLHSTLHPAAASALVPDPSAFADTTGLNTMLLLSGKRLFQELHVQQLYSPKCVKIEPGSWIVT